MTAPQGRVDVAPPPTARSLPARAWVGWAAGATTYLIALFNRGSLGVAGPLAAQRLGIGATALSSFTAVQLLVFVAAQMPVGLLVDRYGPRRTLASSLVLMAVGQVVVATGETFPVVLAARALLGCGDAMVMISVLRLIAAWFPHARAPVLAQVTVVVGTAGGLVAAPPLSAALHAYGWEPVFLTCASATGAMVAVVWCAVRDRPPREPDAARPVASAPLRAELGAAWRQPDTRLGLFLMFLVQFPVQVFVLLWGFPFLTEGEGLTAGTASYLTAVPLVVTMVSGPLFGLVSGARPHWRLALVFVVTGATTLAWCGVLFWPGSHAPTVLLFVLAAVLGLGNPAAMFGLDIARAGSPARRVGAVSGIANMGGYAAALVAMMLIGVVLDHTHSPSSPPALGDYRIALSTQAVLQAVGLALLLHHLLRHRKRAAPPA